MKEYRFQEIQETVARFDKLPDAAFISALAEHGVDAADLTAYAREQEKRERALRRVRGRR